MRGQRGNGDRDEQQGQPSDKSREGPETDWPGLYLTLSDCILDDRSATEKQTTVVCIYNNHQSPAPFRVHQNYIPGQTDILISKLGKVSIDPLGKQMKLARKVVCYFPTIYDNSVDVGHLKVTPVANQCFNESVTFLNFTTLHT